MGTIPDYAKYQATIQNPSVCFSDPDLSAGEVLRFKKPNDWKPVPWPGESAVVFRLTTPEGQWAVRCFVTKITDQQERYEKFRQHVSGKLLPMLVYTDYQVKGIKLEDKNWYPIVKMEWANGEDLDSHVGKLVRTMDKNGLGKLAKNWLDVVTSLQYAQIAHGDLQHENILVNNGQIRLVDYDGVFVPSLSGRMAIEIGHPNYRHPLRKKSDFNLDIDNFPALVIYLSLRALSVDPDLWELHKDKNLIFLSNDFKSPDQSECFDGLKRNADPEVRDLASKLGYFCAVPLSSVPRLNTLVPSWKKTWKGMEQVTLPIVVSWDPPNAFTNSRIFYNIPQGVRRTAKLIVKPTSSKIRPRIRIKDLPEWLSVTPMSFTPPAVLTITIDTRNLEEGTRLDFSLEFILDE